MEFELIVAKFLYKYGTISLPGIGIISMQNGVPDAEYISKNKNLPVEGIEFKYNPSVAIQPEFIEYFAEQRGKIKSLAVSDIESKLQLTKQLLNIGNPYDVPGIGIFMKQNDGSLKMQPGYFINPNQEIVNKGYKLKERNKEANPVETPFDDEQPKRNLKPFIWITVLLAVVALAWFGYNWWQKSSTDPNTNDTNTPEQSAVNNTADTLVASTNTLVAGVDSNAIIPAPVSLDTMKFKVYVRSITGKTEAVSRYTNTYSRWQNKVYMETGDSSRYDFYVLVTMAVADTALKRDSLEKFYQYKVRYQPVQ